jgi:hypothetical protein
MIAGVLMIGSHASAAEVKLIQEGTAVRVEIDGKPFTTYRFAAGTDDAAFHRPYAYPVFAADGQEITSDQIKTNPKEHPHHRSFWVSHGNVNGVDHWSHAFAAGKEAGRQKHVAFDKVEGDTIVQRVEWSGKGGAGPAVLNETRTLRFFALEDGTRGIDLTVTLVPAGNEPVTLGDTKEAGLCSVRVHPEIGNGEKDKAKARKGTLTLSTGATGEKNVWGKPAAWCDESGEINGKKYGVAIFDHPDNARHPTCWHSREYGLHAANPFGLHDFDKTKPQGAGDFKIEPGKPATFKFRVLFHTGDAAGAKLDERYKAWTGK